MTVMVAVGYLAGSVIAWRGPVCRSQKSGAVVDAFAEGEASAKAFFICRLFRLVAVGSGNEESLIGE
jgi:hypothetical protein